MGILAYEMLKGKAPFSGENNEKTYANICMQEVGLEGLSVEATDFIAKSLEKRVEERLTLEEMEVHPWIVSI